MSAHPVLLLPGMMLDRRMYGGQLTALAGAPAIVGDLTRGESIETLATQVLAEAPPRFALVGMSMGGIVALEIWRRARERVTHLALLDTTPHPDKPQRRELRMEQIAKVETGKLRDVLVESMKPLYLARRNRTSRRLLQSIVDQAVGLGPDVFRRQSLALRDRPDSVATLATIDCPALVLCGREDALCPVEWHVAMADAMPRADLVVLAECGHLSTMEEPAAVTAALGRLLRRRS
ncbi:MAG: alpha/beta hydrolase [Steroidobacteraceae bacterium]|nr:alpha/beta hydrolase [Steroidobacteraceae bacterium]